MCRNVNHWWFLTGRANANLLLFSAALQVINRISTNALKNVYGVPGEDITAMCGLYLPGTWKFFCRKNCEAGNILIKTKELLAQRKRYKTQFKEISPGFFSLYVSISELTQSDSGIYRCGLGYYSKPAFYQDFRLFVADGKSLINWSRGFNLSRLLLWWNWCYCDQTASYWEQKVTGYFLQLCWKEPKIITSLKNPGVRSLSPVPLVPLEEPNPSAEEVVVKKERFFCRQMEAELKEEDTSLNL